MYVATKQTYLTNSVGSVRVIKVGGTISPAEYRKLSDYAQAKFTEVERKVRLSRESKLEQIANELIDELLIESREDSEATPINDDQYSNVLTDWITK